MWGEVGRDMKSQWKADIHDRCGSGSHLPEYVCLLKTNFILSFTISAPVQDHKLCFLFLEKGDEVDAGALTNDKEQ